MTTQPSLRYFGLSSFELSVGDTRVLVDPWFEDPEWSTWTVADFEAVDDVFVTHGARDHLGDTLPIARASGATVVTEPAVAEHLRAAGLPDEQTRTVIWGNRMAVTDEIEARVLETRHLSYFESVEQTLSGMPLGFHFEFPGTSLYYVGDTSLFGDLELFVAHHDPDVVLLPVGSAPGDLAPMPPEDAARATAWFDDVTVVPVHYVPGSDEPATYRDAVEREVDDPPQILELDPGERTSLPP